MTGGSTASLANVLPVGGSPSVSVGLAIAPPDGCRCGGVGVVGVDPAPVGVPIAAC